MKKINLIFAIVFMLCLNGRAQSLNIVENLLDVNSSTFNNNSWGNWSDQGSHCGKSLQANGGSGNSGCLHLTPQGNASEDHNAQLKYAFDATLGTTYVFRLKAKKLNESSGTIKVILQHNSDGYEQIKFFEENVTDEWETYDGEVIADRVDYNVIMINYGFCGDVLIDDIEFGVKAVAPSFKTNLETSYTVGQGGTLTLSVEASGTPTPKYKWYRNTTNSTAGATLIDDATTASYSVPTTEQGTTYYYCVANNSQGDATSTIAGVTVTAPVHATGVTLDKTSASVKQGKTITLTATVEPAAAVNKNVIWSSNNTSVATVSNGVVTGVATGNAQITATTVDGNYKANCTVTVTTSLPPVLIADFNDIASLDGTISPHYASYVVTPARNDNMYIDLIADPYNDGKCVAVSDGNHKDQEYCTINLPNTVNIKDYGILAFDICYPEKSTDDDGQHESMNYKAIPISLIYTDRNSATQTVNLATFNTPVFPAPVWDTKMIGLESLADKDFEGASNFQIKIGPINSNRCIYYLDNIRIKENVDDVEDYTQDDDLSDIWWKYEDETLYIKGTGPIPAYKNNKKCPWKDLGNDRTPYIKHVIVSEGITAIGDYSVGNSQKDNVDITLHSIPEYFGEKCLKREYAENLTRTLHLQLWDAEKPFIAKTKSTYFPTFNTTKYFRNVTNTYSTVCLPFPVAEATVTDAGAELFDFTSIEKNEEQYTLSFTKHEGGMTAGQTYLVKKNDIEGTLQNTNVTKEQFNLTPSVSTNTVENSDPSFSISMTGVFQPSVFGPNLGTKQDPVYAYGFQNEAFYMNGGNMSIRPMRGYFYGSQLYNAPAHGEQQEAKKMPSMMRFHIAKDNVTGVEANIADANDEGFEIKEVYNLNGVKTNSLTKGVNIIRTSTGKVMKVVVK